jgi:hypothetical protein
MKHGMRARPSTFMMSLITQAYQPIQLAISGLFLFLLSDYYKNPTINYYIFESYLTLPSLVIEVSKVIKPLRFGVYLVNFMEK